MYMFGVTGKKGKPVQKKLNQYYDGKGNIKEGYIISNSPTEKYEMAEKITLPEKIKRSKSTVKRTPGKNIYVYKKTEEKKQAAQPPTPTPKPEPKEEKKVEKGPDAYSPEIQSAITRVKNYESPFGGANANTENRGYNGFGNANQSEQENKQKQKPQVDPQSFLDKYKMDFKMKPAVNDVSVEA